MEIFCGTAGVSASFKKAGFGSAIAVDKFKPKAPLSSVLQLDLTKAEDQATILSWVQNPAVKAVFLAPPCGTSSLARTIEIPGEEAPKPLRTLDMPNGICGLQGLDLERVSQANILYQLCADIMDICTRLNKPCMLENPRNSLFWITSFWLEAESAASQFVQDHQACAYQGKRPKWTRLSANFKEVHTVCKTCDGSHTHEPWGLVQQGSKRVFATSLEVHYPPKLCDAVVHAFMLHLVDSGLSLDNFVSMQDAATTFTNKQTAKAKLPPVVQPFKCQILTFFSAHQCLWPPSFSTSEQHKLLHDFSLGDVGTEQLSLRTLMENKLKSWNLDLELLKGVDDNVLEICTNVRIFGVQWEPEEFLNQAKATCHPLQDVSPVPLELVKAIENNALQSPHEVAKKRVMFFKKWVAASKSLSSEESALRDKMDPQVNAATSGKRIVLFHRILEDLGYPDLGVVDELRQGVPLIGEVPATSMLPFKFSPALISEEGLRMHASMRRSKIMQQSCSSGDSEVDSEVWSKTLEECEQKWLRGPLDEDSVPVDAPISKRFGLKQRHKTRLIDDYSESSVNDAVSVQESPVLHTIDIACAAVALWFGIVMGVDGDSQLLARTFDLSSAYRQVALSPEGRSYSHIRVHNPETGRVSLFQALVLPFGAVRSVHSFLRLARAIWWVGVVGCDLFWSSFYDDYIVFSTRQLAKSTEATVISLLKLLGWLFAEDGRKCEPFNTFCDALGVVFDLSESCSGICKIGNTASRIEEICAEIQRILEKGALTQTEAQKLRGRMQFAEAQVYGRAGKRCVATLRDLAACKRSKLSELDRFLLKLFCDSLQSANPRIIRANKQDHCLMITDACYERDAQCWICGLGAVFCDTGTGSLEFFSVELSAEQRLALGENHKQQIIFEAETLCGVLAYFIWCERCASVRSCLHVDNEGTKFAMIKCFSTNECVDCLVRIFAEKEVESRCNCWISRVSSFSNIADKPSRGDCSQLRMLRAKDVSEYAQTMLARIFSAMKFKMGN